MRSKARIFGLVLVFVLLTIITPPRAGATTNPNPVLTANPVLIGDSYTDSSSPGTNFASATTLKVGMAANVYKWHSWLIWNLASVPSNAQVLSCSVNLEVETVNTNLEAVASIQVWLPQTSWNPNTITWNNQPSVGTFQDSNTGITNLSALTRVSLPFTNICTRYWFSGSNSGIRISLQWAVASTSNPVATFSSNETNYVVQKPLLTVQYQLPSATVLPFFFCSGGPCSTDVFTGEGLPSYLFNVSAAENNGTFHRVNPLQIGTNISTYLSIRVSDFFGNTITTVSFVVTGTPFYKSIPIPYRLLQAYNAQDNVTSLTITPGGSANPIGLDLMPRSLYQFPLKSAVSVWVNFTLRNLDYSVKSTFSLHIPMTNPTSYIVNGTTITQLTLNVTSTTSSFKTVYSNFNTTWHLVNGVWSAANDTKAVATIGVISANAPKGLDFFKAYSQGWAIAGGFFIGLNIWTVLLGLEIALVVWLLSPAGFSNKIRTKPRSWPKRLQVLVTVIVVLGFLLGLAAILATTTGSFIVPFPISNV